MGSRTGRMPRVARKSAREIERMRAVGRVLSRVLKALSEAAQAGTTTAELDRIAERIILEAGGRPSFKGYRGYPATICVEPEDVVVHGIPCDQVVLREGQILGIDVGAELDGYHADAAITVAIGDVSPEKLALLNATREALFLGIAQAVPGNRLRDISAAIQNHVERLGYSVVRDLVGHGIGRAMHEPPQVPNFVEEGQFAEYDLTLRPGMTLAIEPMVNMGGRGVTQDEDRWTVRTADGLPSAHFEHTIAVTRGAPLVLTSE